LIFFAITDSTAGVFVRRDGHGMRAALITAIMRGLIEELMPVAADAGKISDGNQPEPARDSAAHARAVFGNGILRGGGCHGRGVAICQCRAPQPVSIAA